MSGTDTRTGAMSYLQLAMVVEAQAQELAQLKQDYAQLKEAYDATVAGVPLGPLIGTQTILNQQREITRLNKEVAAVRADRDHLRAQLRAQQAQTLD